MPLDPEISKVSSEEYVRKTTSPTLYLSSYSFLHLNQSLSYPLRSPFCSLLAYACIYVWMSVCVCWQRVLRTRMERTGLLEVKGDAIDRLELR